MGNHNADFFSSEQSHAVYSFKLYTFQETVSGMLLGPGRDRAPDHGASNDHVTRTTLISIVRTPRPKSQMGINQSSD